MLSAGLFFCDLDPIIAAMSTFTWIVVVGSWVLLLVLTLLAYRFNRDRGND